MPKKRTSLEEEIGRKLGVRSHVEDALQEEPLIGIADKSSSLRPSRVGKRIVAGYFDPVVSRQLKILAAERDSNIQELLREALNDFFEKNGKARLA